MENEAVQGKGTRKEPRVSAMPAAHIPYVRCCQLRGEDGEITDRSKNLLHRLPRRMNKELQ